jgi:CheY-like chemotaxis protein
MRNDRARNVLVVDDDLDIRESLTEALGEQGFAVDTAADGRDALNRVALAPPDLILLDLMMPVMDGFSVLRQLAGHSGWSRIPVVVITASPWAVPVGAAFGVLPKPVELDQLFAEIDRALGLGRDRRRSKGAL